MINSTMSVFFMVHVRGFSGWKRVVFVSLWATTTFLYAETTHFQGELEVVELSGGACKSEFKKTYAVDLVLETQNDLDNNAISGFFHGRGLTPARFAGMSFTDLHVTYPYLDPALAQGHQLQISVHDGRLTGELNEKYFGPETPQCSFTRATLRMHAVSSGVGAEQKRLALGRGYDAYLWDSRSLAAFRRRNYALSLEHALKAIELVSSHCVYLERAALACLKLGDREQAVSWLKKAVIAGVEAEELNKVAQYHDILYRIHGQYPHWAVEKLESASTLPVTLNTPKAKQAWLQLRNEIFFLNQRGQYEEAAPLLQEALKIAVDHFGENHPDTLQTMENLATSYHERAFFGKAEALYDEVLSKSREILGATHPRTLGIMNNLAGLHDTLGRTEQAGTLYERVLSLRKQILGEQHLDTMETMNDLALFFHFRGMFEEAESLYQNALTRRLQVLGEYHPLTLSSRNNLAALYRSRGLYAEATSLSESVLLLHRRVQGENHPQTLAAKNNLAQIYNDRAIYGEAGRLFESTLAARRELLGERHPDTQISMQNLAHFYFSQGKFEKGESLARSTLSLRREVLGEKHPDTLSSLHDLAHFHNARGLYAEADSLFQSVLSTSWEVQGKTHPYSLAYLNNLALFYHARGFYDTALPLYEIGLALSEEAMGEAHPLTLSSMNNLATVYQSRGSCAEAEILLARALSLSRNVLGPYHPDTLMTTTNLAFNYQAQNKLESADHAWRESLERINRFLDLTFWGASENTRRFHLGNHRGVLWGYLSYFFQRDNPATAEHVLFYAMTRKGLLLEVAAEFQRLARIAGQSALKQPVRQLREKKQRFAELTLAGPGKQDPSVFKEYLHKLEEEIERLEVLLSDEVGPLRSQMDWIETEAPHEMLADDQLLVDFLVFHKMDSDLFLPYEQEQLAAVVVDPTHEPPVMVLDLGILEPVAEEIDRYRKGMISRKDTSEFRSAGRELYRRLWAPFASNLEGKRTIYIVPDGPLHLLPFGALIDESGSYLVQKHNIELLSSSRDPLRPRMAGSPGEPALFFNPDYGPVPDTAHESEDPLVDTGVLRHTVFRSLPGTKKEGSALQDMFREHGFHPRVYEGERAGEQALRKVSSPKVLHIATHGFFLDDLPAASGPGRRDLDLVLLPSLHKTRKIARPGKDPRLWSGLALSGANQGARGIKQESGDDGILTALEALWLNLEGTELVVLSACDTGVGTLRRGEGYYGLRTAFREAGAKAVLSTLWRVDDEGTRAFMKRFYKLYLGGTPPQEALRQTQREFLKGDEWSGPYFWAPFIMVGRD